MPRPDAPVSLAAAHAVDGEEMEYEVALRGLPVGRVQVVVGRRGELLGQHGPVVIVRSGGASGGVVALVGELRWEMSTTVELHSGFAVGEDERFTAKGLGAKNKHEHTKRSWTTHQAHHNIHSATGALRGWRSDIGDLATADVYFGQSPMNVELRDVARETVGRIPAVRYDGVADAQFNVSIWISDDVARVPLRVQTATPLGDLEVDLVHYEAPRD